VGEVVLLRRRKATGLSLSPGGESGPLTIITPNSPCETPLVSLLQSTSLRSHSSQNLTSTRILSNTPHLAALAFYTFPHPHPIYSQHQNTTIKATLLRGRGLSTHSDLHLRSVPQLTTLHTQCCLSIGSFSAQLCGRLMEANERRCACPRLVPLVSYKSGV
jgi:hypothetical protein